MLACEAPVGHNVMERAGTARPIDTVQRAEES